MSHAPSKFCHHDGCSYVSRDDSVATNEHNISSHISNVHSQKTKVWYGATQVTIHRDLKSKEMTCPCGGYSNVNASLVRRHAAKSHKGSVAKHREVVADSEEERNLASFAKPSAASSRSSASRYRVVPTPKDEKMHVEGEDRWYLTGQTVVNEAYPPVAINTPTGPSGDKQWSRPAVPIPMPVTSNRVESSQKALSSMWFRLVDLNARYRQEVASASASRPAPRPTTIRSYVHTERQPLINPSEGYRDTVLSSYLGKHAREEPVADSPPPKIRHVDDIASGSTTKSSAHTSKSQTEPKPKGLPTPIFPIKFEPPSTRQGLSSPAMHSATTSTKRAMEAVEPEHTAKVRRLNNVSTVSESKAEVGKPFGDVHEMKKPQVSSSKKHRNTFVSSPLSPIVGTKKAHTSASKKSQAQATTRAYSGSSSDTADRAASLLYRNEFASKTTEVQRDLRYDSLDSYEAAYVPVVNEFTGPSNANTFNSSRLMAVSGQVVKHKSRLSRGSVHGHASSSSSSGDYNRKATSTLDSEGKSEESDTKSAPVALKTSRHVSRSTHVPKAATNARRSDETRETMPSVSSAYTKSESVQVAAPKPKPPKQRITKQMRKREFQRWFRRWTDVYRCERDGDDDDRAGYWRVDLMRRQGGTTYASADALFQALQDCFNEHQQRIREPEIGDDDDLDVMQFLGAFSIVAQPRIMSSGRVRKVEEQMRKIGFELDAASLETSRFRYSDALSQTKPDEVYMYPCSCLGNTMSSESASEFGARPELMSEPTGTCGGEIMLVVGEDNALDVYGIKGQWVAVDIVH